MSGHAFWRECPRTPQARAALRRAAAAAAPGAEKGIRVRYTGGRFVINDPNST
ncbi:MULTISPECIES: hypothetical protein [Streptomyces]|uniref:hypothetical protein n=1 Tax=Streptomyces TaxID=1883 RepID=UPI0013315F59|nr:MULTISPECIES: hypothetical protein [Streptomyces]